MRCPCLALVLAVCLSAIEDLYFEHEPNLIKGCDSVTCQPDPAVSAFFAPWLLPEGAPVLARHREVEVLPAAVVDRGLRVANYTRDRDGYYTRFARPCTVTVGGARGATLAGDASSEVARGRGAAARRAHAFAPKPGGLKHPNNMYHVWADNLLPMVDALQDAPGCNASTLTCDLPPELWLPARSKPNARWLGKSPTGPTLHWFELVVETIFGGRVVWYDAPPAPVERLTVGAQSPVYQDDTARGRRIVDALRRRLGAGRAGRAAGAAHVIHVTRSLKGAGDNRVVAAASAAALSGALSRAFGAAAADCCPVLTSAPRRLDPSRAREVLAPTLDALAGADVLFSLHGAGYTNILFAARGAVLVQLYGAKGWEQINCRRLASFVHGGYVRAPMAASPKAHALLGGADQAAVIARCAAAVWRVASPLALRASCFPAGPRFVTEAWTSTENYVRRRPPPPRGPKCENRSRGAA